MLWSQWYPRAIFTVLCTADHYCTVVSRGRIPRIYEINLSTSLTLNTQTGAQTASADIQYAVDI